MKEEHYLKKIVKYQSEKVPLGIFSICSSNPFVIRAAINMAKKQNNYLLIESTSNQVNQFGGYTGMKPNDFSDLVYSIAESEKFSSKKIILGGDHLGPNPWKSEPANKAMKFAKEMVKGYIKAGFDKIHLDASMKLKDDIKNFNKNVIAKRTSELCKTCEQAYEENKEDFSSPPLYVIGSEVPAPGGSISECEGINITSPEDFKDTVITTKKAFIDNGLTEAWKRVIAVVVQPGVDFYEYEINPYNPQEAKPLVEALDLFSNLIFEGHSTDYQSSESLKEMVEDGIAILKVGPALTFAMREALFSLSHIENELINLYPDAVPSKFIKVLDCAMQENPTNWKNYHTGTEAERKLARKYSLYDRTRYYLMNRKVKESIETLLNNLDRFDVPKTLISQYLPRQYKKISDKKLEFNPRKLVEEKISDVLKRYNKAVSP